MKFLVGCLTKQFKETIKKKVDSQQRIFSDGVCHQLNEKLQLSM
jgi:hypothetical protein